MMVDKIFDNWKWAHRTFILMFLASTGLSVAGMSYPLEVRWIWDGLYLSPLALGLFIPSFTYLLFWFWTNRPCI